MSKSCPRNVQELSKSYPRVVPEWSQSGPRVVPEWSQSCPELSRVVQSYPKLPRVTQRKKRGTDRRTDGSRDTPSYRDARTHLKILVTHAYTHMHANAHAYTHARTYTHTHTHKHTHKHICPHHNSILPRLRPKRPTNGPSNNDGITNLNKFWLVQIFTTWSHMHEKKTNKNKSPGISRAN